MNNTKGLTIAKARLIFKALIMAAIVLNAFAGVSMAQEKEASNQDSETPFSFGERLASDKKVRPEAPREVVANEAMTPPGNDNFANATLLTAGSTINVSIVDATGEVDEPIHGAGRGGFANGQNSVWYKYVANMSGVITFTTGASQTNVLDDTVLSVYTGSAVNSLTRVAESDDHPGNAFYSKVSFCATAGQTYYVAVDGWEWRVGTFTLNLSLSNVAANDNFANAKVIALSDSHFPGMSACTTGATAEAGEPVHGGNSNGHSIWYRLSNTGGRSVTISTAGSLFDTVIAVYTGSSVNGLTLVTANDDFGPTGTRSSRVTFFAMPGIEYRIAVTGFFTETGTSLIYFSENRNESSKRFDFDGNPGTDIGIFRPSNGQWWLNRGFGQTFSTTFGTGADRVTPADFTGDGKVDIAYWRPSNGTWYIFRSEDYSYYEAPFGTLGDIPVAGYFDNDFRADLVVFRPSTGTWYISGSRGQTFVVQFGSDGDVPVVADYDGDGVSDLAIYRPSNGQWWIRRSKLGVVAATFGTAGDKPVPGDYTGDGRTDIAVFRPATGQWLILRSEDSSYYAFPFGISTDTPAPGDYDNDGKFDATVFRDGTWYSQQSTLGIQIIGFGSAGDKPVASSYMY